MMKAYARRVAAGAVISAALTAGSLGLTASAMECTDPKCVSGTPPVQAALTSCPDPKCISGTPPAVAALVSCGDPKCVSGTTPAEATLNHLPLVGHKRARIDLT